MGRTGRSTTGQHCNAALQPTRACTHQQGKPMCAYAKYQCTCGLFCARHICAIQCCNFCTSAEIMCENKEDTVIWSFDISSWRTVSHVLHNFDRLFSCQEISGTHVHGCLCCRLKQGNVRV